MGTANTFLLSPQTPPDVAAVPFADKPLSLLGLSSKSLDALKELDILTLGDVPDLMAWENIPGIGPKTATKVEELFLSMKGA
jgi:hypothetical protein